MRHRNNFAYHRDIHLKLKEIIQLRLLFGNRDYAQRLYTIT